MESVQVRQRLRPSSYAFIINEHDLNQAAEAASLNSAIWGGIFNPIAPIESTEKRDGILRCFDPDFIINLSNDELPQDLSGRYGRNSIGRNEIVASTDLPVKRKLALGFDISALISYVHEKELRFTNSKSRATLISTSTQNDGLAEFAAIAYGSFKFLPALDVPFEQMFQDGLRAKQLELHNLTPLDDYANRLLPIDFTRYGLRVIRKPGSFSSHIIFVGNHRSCADLVEYWNIRATGCATIFIPLESFREFEPLIRVLAEDGQYPINQQIQNSADLQKGPSVSDDDFGAISDWISTLNVGTMPRRKWTPGFGAEHNPIYVGDLHAAHIFAVETDETLLLDGETMVPIKAAKPPILAELQPKRGEYRWSIDVSVSGGTSSSEFTFSFPNAQGLQEIARRSVFGSPDEVRLGAKGLVLLQDSMSSRRIYMSPVKCVEVIQALFKQAGLEISPSQPGHYSSQIIQKMGSLHGDCRVFKIRGIREVLDKLGNGSSLTKGNIHQIVTNRTADEHGINWRPELYNGVVHNRAARSLDFDFATAFDILLDKRILRPGFEMKCRTCFKEDWYHVSEFAEDFTCRFCFTKQRVDFAHKRDWQYKSDGLFRIPDSAQGSVAVILSLWRLHHFRHRLGGYFTTSHNVSGVNETFDCEVDYVYVSTDDIDGTYDIVIGQATRFGDFNDVDMRKMSTVCDRFLRKPYIAFSTLKDRYTDADKARFKSLVDAGYKVIAFTREELDPYDLYDRFDQAPYKHPHDLAELSTNTLELNVFA